MKIETLIGFNKVLDINIARLIRGPTGIGKSSVVRQVAQSMGARLVDVRLPELEPTDLVGLPYLASSNGEKTTKYARPDWWPTDPKEKVILFLDEADRASEDMQPIAMQLCLDRKAGGRKLPENVTVWAACNGEKYMTFPLDQALVDRFAVIDLFPSVEEWRHWAEENKINRSVISFIDKHPGRLDTPPNLIGKPNIVCPSRRSWSQLGLMLNNLKGDLSKEENLVSYARAFVGYSDGEAFAQHVKETYQTVSAKDIMSGSVNPTDLNILQISSIMNDIISLFMETKTPKFQKRNCLKFFINASDEVFAAFFSALPSKAGFIIEKFPEADDFFKSKKKIMVERDVP